MHELIAMMKADLDEKQKIINSVVDMANAYGWAYIEEDRITKQNKSAIQAVMLRKYIGEAERILSHEKTIG